MAERVADISHAKYIVVSVLLYYSEDAVLFLWDINHDLWCFKIFRLFKNYDNVFQKSFGLLTYKIIRKIQ